jgi:hypothetical protein
MFSEKLQLKKWDPVRTGGLSALIPGAGQVYTGHYVMGGTFLTMEVVTALITRFWYINYKELLDKENLTRNAASFAKNRKDRLWLLEEAEVSRFDARSAKYTMYDALSWMIGGYVYNVCDAIKSSRHFDSDTERSAMKAGWLAAIPGLGLGQMYNGEISKAGRVMMGQVSLGVIAINEHRLMKKAQYNYNRITALNDTGISSIVNEYREVWDSRQTNAFKDRNTYLWYSIFFYLYGVIDAVVDAHLHDYERKMQVYPDLISEQGTIGVNVEYRF